jgi:hypothetical protein
LRYRVELIRFAAGCVLALGGAFALWACGPFLPNWLLASDSYVLDAPTVWFKKEVAPVLAAGTPKPAAVPAQEPFRETSAVAVEDLQEALGKAGTPAARREELLGQYRAFRDGVVSYGDALAKWQDEASWADPVPPRPAFREVAIPAGLPAEFADYEKGALAYHLGRMEEARAAWEKLLARPAGERRYRTTWAAYMLGRSAVESDPDAAAKWFGKTRDFAAQGFQDPLGLAAASLGWEARAEMGRGRHDEALKLYAQQAKSGDPRALESLRRAARSALAKPETARRAARSPEARPIVTAYVLSDWTRIDYEGPLDPAKAQAWLAAIQAEKVVDVKHADRLAWAAYRAGDFAAAQEWLTRAAADAPMARFLRAKLLMRDGKLAEAEALLAEAAPALPEKPADGEELWTAYDNGVQPAGKPRALGELGAVRLARKEYAPALDALLRSGYWVDAAYVAERVLSLDELKAYVDREWPRASGTPALSNDVDVEEGWQPLYAGVILPEPKDVDWNLRNLLGRRLVRAGRHAEALPYLIEESRPAVEELASALKAGQDAKRPAAERAGNLFRAACVMRHQGLEIAGTELEPDWAMSGGSYDQGSFTEARENPETHRQLAATEDERTRVRKSRTEPFERFHYRFRGADLAWEAASLLSDGSPEKARMLTVAGTWIKNRDPKAADRFYRALVSCCGQTDLGREAARVKWFPEVEDCAPAAEEGGEP